MFALAIRSIDCFAMTLRSSPERPNEDVESTSNLVVIDLGGTLIGRMLLTMSSRVGCREAGPRRGIDARSAMLLTCFSGY